MSKTLTMAETTMDLEQLMSLQQTLLNQTLIEGIKRNEEQIRVWIEYKNCHENVIKGLETFPLELTTNCMVPIGKKALMKGTLVHTNEILVCLGDGYFAKYSAVQAIALCNRRIKQAEEMLKNLEKERCLFEMHQILPCSQDAFGSEERPNFYEHWDERKVEDWRVEHRKREKEYREKLKELRNQEKPGIRTEEDILHRLDELELEEDLKDEINRLEGVDYNVFDENVEDSDNYYDSSDEDEGYDEDSSLKEKTSKLSVEEELVKLESVRAQRLSLESSKEPDLNTNEEEKSRVSTNQSVNDNFNINSITSRIEEGDQNVNIDELPNENVVEDLSNASEIQPNPDESAKHSTEHLSEALSQSLLNKNDLTKKLDNESEQLDTKERRVSFAEPHHIDVEIDSSRCNTSTLSLDERLPKIGYKHKGTENEDNDEEDIIQINFTHSNNNPEIHVEENDTINSPKDIYRLYCKPKSILKRRHNDVSPHNNFPPAMDYDNSEDEEEDEVVKGSIYSAVVKDIKERNPEAPEVIESVSAKRPVSRFKMARSMLKK